MLSKGQLCSYLAYIFSRSINSHDFISPPSHSPLVGLAMLSYLLPPLSMVNSNRLLTPTTALLSSTATPCTLEITAPGCLGASSVIASKTHRQIKTRRLQNWMTLKIKGRLAPPITTYHLASRYLLTASSWRGQGYPSIASGSLAG